MTYQQETDAAKLGAVTKYLAIPVPNSEVCQTNAFGAALTLVDQWRYGANDDPNEDNPTSQWHENNYPFWIAGYILEATETMKVAIVWDEKPQNTNGGTFTAGAWRQRDLNTKSDPDNLVSVASNAVTITTSGKYWIRAIAPAYTAGRNQCRITKNGSLLQQGTSEYAATAGDDSIKSVVAWVGQLVANDVIRLEHQCDSTSPTYGFGVGDNSSWGVEIYSIMEIIKLD